MYTTSNPRNLKRFYEDIIKLIPGINIYFEDVKESFSLKMRQSNSVSLVEDLIGGDIKRFGIHTIIPKDQHHKCCHGC